MIERIKNFLKTYFIDIHEREVIKGTIYTLSQKILAILLGYVFTYIVSRFFGAEPLGIYNVAISTLSLASVISSLGFDQAILRFFAQYSNNRNILFLIYKKILSIAIPFSIFISSILIFFSKKISLVLTKSDENYLYFLMVSFAVPFLTFSAINTEAVRGLKYVKESEFFRMLLSSITSLIVLTIIINFFSFSPLLPIISSIAGIVVTAFFSAKFLFKHMKIKKEKSHLINTPELLHVSMPMFIVAISNLINNYIPVFLLAYLKSPKEVGIFNIAFKIATVTSFMLVSINSIVAPKFAELYWQKKYDQLKRVVFVASKINFWTSIPLLLLFLCFPKFFTGIFGKEFIAGSKALIILTIGQFVNAFSGSVGYLLIMTGKQKIFQNVFVTSTFMNAILSIIFIPLFEISGAAIGFSMSMIFWNLFSAMYIFFKLKITTFYFPFLKLK